MGDRIREVDVLRTAAQLISRHGVAAFFVAAQRYDDMAAKSDADGARVWKQVVAVVEELQQAVPPEGTPRH